MRGSLDRNRIMKLFETLSARLAARGTRGQLYIVGGSAMIVSYGWERTTRDVDARNEYAKDEVLDAAEAIADRGETGPELAQRERQAVHAAGQGRSGAHRSQQAGLVVTGASAEHMLAMKIDAARNSDEDDIGVLVESPVEAANADLSSGTAIRARFTVVFWRSAASQI